MDYKVIQEVDENEISLVRLARQITEENESTTLENELQDICISKWVDESLTIQFQEWVVGQDESRDAVLIHDEVIQVDDEVSSEKNV